VRRQTFTVKPLFPTFRNPGIVMLMGKMAQGALNSDKNLEAGLALVRLLAGHGYSEIQRRSAVMKSRARFATGLGTAARPGGAAAVTLLAALSLAGTMVGCGGSPVDTVTGVQANATVVVTIGASSTLGPSSTAPPASSTLPSTGTTASATTLTGTTGGVSIDYPKAWFERSNGDTGLTVAEREADLAAKDPAGPRFVIDALTDGSVDVPGLVNNMVKTGADPTAPGNAATMSVAADPQQMQVGGRPAVIAILQEGSGAGSTICGYVVVSLADGRSVLLMREAPADQWESARPGLETILSSIRFE
jgi:hypothetical protein